jgi:hypothetical protein
MCKRLPFTLHSMPCPMALHSEYSATQCKTGDSTIEPSSDGVCASVWIDSFTDAADRPGAGQSRKANNNHLPIWMQTDKSKNTVFPIRGRAHLPDGSKCTASEGGFVKDGSKRPSLSALGALARQLPAWGSALGFF